jgi:hypothetical protein
MSVKVNDPMFAAKLFMTFGPSSKYIHPAQDITTVQAYILENPGLFETINNDIINLIIIMNSNPTVRENTKKLFDLTTSGKPSDSPEFISTVENFKTIEDIFPPSLDFDATNAPKLNPNGIIQIVAPKLNLTESQMKNINNIVEGRPTATPTATPTTTATLRTRTPGQAYMGTKSSESKRNALPPTKQRGGFEPFTLMFICLGAMNATCKLTGMKNSVCSGVSNAFNGILDVTLSCLGGVAGALLFGGGRKKSRRRQNKSKQRRQNKSRRRRQK